MATSLWPPLFPCHLLVRLAAAEPRLVRAVAPDYIGEGMGGADGSHWGLPSSGSPSWEEGELEIAITKVCK